MALSDDQIRRLALDTAESVFGASHIDRLVFSAGVDWSGSLSYFLDFVVEQNPNREVALHDRLRLRRDVRDRLFAAGDETYPYVFIHNRALAPAGG